MTTTPIPPYANTVRKARRKLGGIAQPTIYELFATGKLRSFRIGRRRLVSDDAIRDFIAIAERETADALTLTATAAQPSAPAIRLNSQPDLLGNDTRKQCCVTFHKNKSPTDDESDRPP